MLKDKREERFQYESMEVSGDDYAYNDGDNAVSFDFVIRYYAVGEVFSNLAIEKNDGTAGGHDYKANNAPSNTKRPINFHGYDYIMEELEV